MTDTTATRSYRPGQWFGIFGSHATVLLPPSEKDRVAHLWALVDDGAGFDVVLDALISDGLRVLPGFVLVSSEDGETKVVIRGEARAWFTTGDDTVEVAGSSATTWEERSVSGVDASRLVVGDHDPDDVSLFPIANGLVRVAEVLTPPVADAAPGVEVAASPVPVPEPEPEPEYVAEDDAPDTAPQPLVAPDVAPPGPIGPEPITSPPPPPPPVGVPSGPPPAVPPPAVEHDGLTQGGAPQPPPPTVATPVPGAMPRPVATLVFSSGETVEVDRAVLVGRAPEARRFTSGDQPQLIAVPSPAQEISSTHLEIRPGSGADHGSAVVTDLGSTNGTVVVQPGLPPEDLQPGIAVQLVPGAIIDLGDGVTIQVINP